MSIDWVDWSIRVQFRINWTIRPGKFLRMWEESESQKFWSQTERAKIYLKRERESEREIANITVLRAREERGKLVELKLASKRTNDKDRVIKKNCEFPGKKNTKRRKRKRKKMPELSVFFFSCSKKTVPIRIAWYVFRLYLYIWNDRCLNWLNVRSYNLSVDWPQLERVC